MSERAAAPGPALVCTDDERVAAAVAAAGYEVVAAPAAEAALPALRERAFALIAFGEATDRETQAFVDGLTGRRRRDAFVLRCAADVRTGDRFAAWRCSADLVVHPGDLGDLPRMLAAARREKDEFYGRFREACARAGARLGAHA